MLNKKIVEKFWGYYKQVRPPLQSFDNPKKEGETNRIDLSYEAIVFNVPNAIEKLTSSPHNLSMKDLIGEAAWGDKKRRAITRTVFLATLDYCVEHLTMKEYMTLHYYFSGESNAEIARRVGIAEATVSSTKTNAINKIRECLDEV
jgi:hypothetical protein